MSLYEMESSARFRSSSRCRRFRPISTFLIVDYWNTVRRALPESFLIGRFSSTLLSKVFYRTRYFPLRPTLTLVPIDFEVNSCLTSVFAYRCIPEKTNRKKEEDERNYLLAINFYSNLFFLVKEYAWIRIVMIDLRVSRG